MASKPRGATRFPAAPEPLAQALYEAVIAGEAARVDQILRHRRQTPQLVKQWHVIDASLHCRATSRSAPSASSSVSSSVSTASAGASMAASAATAASAALWDPQGCTLLHLVYRRRHRDVLWRLLDEPDVSPNAVDRENGWSLLHHALFDGELQIAFTILERRPDTDLFLCDRDGDTPLDVLRASLRRSEDPVGFCVSCVPNAYNPMVFLEPQPPRLGGARAAASRQQDANAFGSLAFASADASPGRSSDWGRNVGGDDSDNDNGDDGDEFVTVLFPHRFKTTKRFRARRFRGTRRLDPAATALSDLRAFRPRHPWHRRTAWPETGATDDDGAAAPHTLPRWRRYDQAFQHSVWTWGDNSNLVLGHGSQSHAAPLAPLRLHVARGAAPAASLRALLARAAPHVKPHAVSAAHCHMIVPTADALFVHGFGSNGRLGTGDTSSQLYPFALAPRASAPDWDPAAVVATAAGPDHSVFVLEDGSVWTCGSNLSGQLGYRVDGDVGHVPRKVPLPSSIRWVSAAANKYHTVVAADNGEVWSWGADYGQLGSLRSEHATTATTTVTATAMLAAAAATHRPHPVQSMPRRMDSIDPRNGVLALAAGRTTTAVLDRGGAVWVIHQNQRIVLHAPHAPDSDTRGRPYGSEVHECPLRKKFSTSDPYARGDNVDDPAWRHYNATWFDTLMPAYQMPTVSIQIGPDDMMSLVTADGSVYLWTPPQVAVASSSTAAAAAAGGGRRGTDEGSARDGVLRRVWAPTRHRATRAAVGKGGVVVIATALGDVYQGTPRRHARPRPSLQASVPTPFAWDLYRFERVRYAHHAIDVLATTSGAFGLIRRDPTYSLLPFHKIEQSIPFRTLCNKSIELPESAMAPSPRWLVASVTNTNATLATNAPVGVPAVDGTDKDNDKDSDKDSDKDKNKNKDNGKDNNKDNGSDMAGGVRLDPTATTLCPLHEMVTVTRQLASGKQLIESVPLRLLAVVHPVFRPLAAGQPLPPRARLPRGVSVRRMGDTWHLLVSPDADYWDLMKPRHLRETLCAAQAANHATDVVLLLANGARRYAHSAVLASQAEFFRARFDAPWATAYDAEGRIVSDWPDTDPAVADVALRIWYGEMDPEAAFEPLRMASSFSTTPLASSSWSFSASLAAALAAASSSSAPSTSSLLSSEVAVFLHRLGAVVDFAEAVSSLSLRIAVAQVIIPFLGLPTLTPILDLASFCIGSKWFPGVCDRPDPVSLLLPYVARFTIAHLTDFIEQQQYAAVDPSVWELLENHLRVGQCQAFIRTHRRASHYIEQYYPPPVMVPFGPTTSSSSLSSSPSRASSPSRPLPDLLDTLHLSETSDAATLTADTTTAVTAVTTTHRDPLSESSSAADLDSDAAPAPAPAPALVSSSTPTPAPARVTKSEDGDWESVPLEPLVIPPIPGEHRPKASSATAAASRSTLSARRQKTESITASAAAAAAPAAASSVVTSPWAVVQPVAPSPTSPAVTASVPRPPPDSARGRAPAPGVIIAAPPLRRSSASTSATSTSAALVAGPGADAALTPRPSPSLVAPLPVFTIMPTATFASQKERKRAQRLQQQQQRKQSTAASSPASVTPPPAAWGAVPRASAAALILPGSAAVGPSASRLSAPTPPTTSTPLHPSAAAAMWSRGRRAIVATEAGPASSAGSVTGGSGGEPSASATASGATPATATATATASTPASASLPAPVTRSFHHRTPRNRHAPAAVSVAPSPSPSPGAVAGSPSPSASTSIPTPTLTPVLKRAPMSLLAIQAEEQARTQRQQAEESGDGRSRTLAQIQIEESARTALLVFYRATQDDPDAGEWWTISSAS
ncbi:hypothetical protein CXG81DRAFT_18994 [Caulochytrium protostelioides]|uniref:BTB domain-containing protein n=1 Tax=Caulochytrium protostelioides TaxID=1555241 RepID=A0A4P9X7F6_9FUNG|nr:hypothetical protein CXG81DRAFT_18994 [Caulochytrium protostelioides]|eukprot:RKP01174.1 hypothetical protein CXG81DRAFT_18994 [Caulochytrium protostelioides]